MFEQPPPPAEAIGNPSWLPDKWMPGALRWWDGSQWTEHVITPTARQTSERRERIYAALSHLGVWFGGPLTPLAVWSVSPTGSLRRLHARQAFAFQIFYMVGYLVVFFRAALFTNEFGAVLLYLAVGLALAMPQMLRAASGKPPWPWPPFFRLRL